MAVLAVQGGGVGGPGLKKVPGLETHRKSPPGGRPRAPAASHGRSRGRGERPPCTLWAGGRRWCAPPEVWVRAPIPAAPQSVARAGAGGITELPGLAGPVGVLRPRCGSVLPLPRPVVTGAGAGAGGFPVLPGRVGLVEVLRGDRGSAIPAPRSLVAWAGAGACGIPGLPGQVGPVDVLRRECGSAPPLPRPVIAGAGAGGIFFCAHLFFHTRTSRTQYWGFGCTINQFIRTWCANS